MAKFAWKRSMEARRFAQCHVRCDEKRTLKTPNVKILHVDKQILTEFAQ